jgi:5-methylcytosine-specific restriction enzyme subunit McrC
MRVTVLERGRLVRCKDAPLPADKPWERHIPAPLFDALERTEQAREEKEARRAQQNGEPVKSSGVFTFGRRKGRTVATVGPWVGVLEVGDLQLELLPKVDREEQPVRLADGTRLPEVRGNLLTMLDVAGDVPARLRGAAATAIRQGSLKDALVRLFLEALVAELLRGEPRAYVMTEEELGTVRGRLMLREQITRSAGKEHRFWCRFDELVGDPRIGGRLKAACAVLARRSLGAESRRLLHQARALLDEAPDMPPHASAGVHFDRQNERFRDVYNFAGHILADNTPDLRAGQEASFSLLYQMDALFERFIARFIARHVLAGPDLPEALRGWTSIPQGKNHHEYLLYESASRGVLRMKPDLLFRHKDGGKPFIIDTKWKHINASPKTQSASQDLYQLYAYHQRFDCRRVMLLYPSASPVGGSDLSLAPGGAPALSVRFVDLSPDLTTVAGQAKLIEQLRELLKEGVASGGPP